MDPDKKQLIFMLALVGILLLVVSVFVFYPGGKTSESIVVSDNTQVLSIIPTGTDVNTSVNKPLPTSPVVAPTPEQQETAAVITLARSFAEIFGTYSSENQPFSGVNLADMATQEFQQWFTTAWPKLKASFPKKGYYSMSTHALSPKLILSDPVGGKATVEVMVQQEETVGEARSTNYRQLTVEEVRVDSNWLVNKAVWK